ncbi:aspartate carbamoyltransferase catalytic subunit [Candidatus Kinetoplastibacterium oncopeltii TCC290E]|uniref:Aspartate carbamoyltransferase n=1 Tax=Candidatus Kinetoplastidibacterium stringomonadis TCC290E TaxID=1208920 RepID=M1L6K8_9PROT|nr:aspartate carbamoyltransferase [Candidatus Kinetoplastibacterium oncopeltii]AGF48213.1 aspartate carbamoyltransferase catalytic subunit [Candidatus Kinetoplastibacterium oncopeltii TCC290E]
MFISQQEFLFSVIKRLDITKNILAVKLGVSLCTLNSWLLPEDSAEFLIMPTTIKRFISKQLLCDKDNIRKYYLRDSIAVNGKNHLLSVDQFHRDSLEDFFRVTDSMKPISRRQKISRILEGAVLGNLFFEASTRTRVSFGAAFCRLGGSVCDTTGFTFSSMAKGESIYDTSRVMGGYVDIMVVRHPEQGSVAEFSRSTNIPIVNGGDGPGEHPSQALLDLYTIRTEFSRLGKSIDGSSVVMIGDLKYGRTVHSLLKLLSLYKGLKISLFSPPGLEMPDSIINYASVNGNHIDIKSSLEEGLDGVDVVYATRVQKERFENPNDEYFDKKFQIDLSKINSNCKKDTIIMHPLPRDGRPGANDLSTDLNNDNRLAIFRQADNGIPVRMAIFAILLGVDHLVNNSLHDVQWSLPAYIGPDDSPFYCL